MKLFFKGIVTREDAELAMQHGVDGIFVSNHGGRADETLRPAIDSLVDVAAGTREAAMPLVLDGGIRRGTDIFKAMALGATAVGIGRPYIWGLASFGQEGVEMVLGDPAAGVPARDARRPGTTSVKKHHRRSRREGLKTSHAVSRSSVSSPRMRTHSWLVLV